MRLLLGVVRTGDRILSFYADTADELASSQFALLPVAAVVLEHVKTTSRQRLFS